MHFTNDRPLATVLAAGFIVTVVGIAAYFAMHRDPVIDTPEDSVHAIGAPVR